MEFPLDLDTVGNTIGEIGFGFDALSRVSSIGEMIQMSIGNVVIPHF